MKRKRIMQRIAVFLLVLAMQSSVLAYAAEPADAAASEETAVTEGAEPETPEEETKPEEPEAPEEETKPEEPETPEEGTEPEEPEDPEEGEEPEEPETPVVPGETGTPGWYAQGSDWYYYDANGAKATGWRYVNGSWYYLDGANAEKPGVMLASTRQVIDGQTYFFAAGGAMRTGWIKEAEGWYYASGSGAMATGWLWLGSVWYYLDGANEEHPGLMLESCRKVIGNATYFFAAGGAMRTGWIKEAEGWYYGDNTSSTGWKYINGAWYYLDGANAEYPGLMLENCRQAIGGATYFFRTSGAMYTGWVQMPEGWYYASGSGAMATGWMQVGGKWYYLDPANEEYPGLMVSSCEMEIGGQTYTFHADGAMRAGWVKDADGSWHYYDTNSGLVKTGWQFIGGVWYYLDPADGGKMLPGGWHQIGGGWYYMHGSGAMATNWLNLGGKWYYLGGDGAMKTGWQFIDNFWYYMYTQNDPHGGEWGVMASNTSIDGYFLQPNGAMMSSEQYGMYLKAQPYASSTGYLILVDRAACRVGVFFGRAGAWNLQYFWECSPGKPSTPTVSGQFTVQGKGYYFDSGSSRCYWYTQFYGDYLFHSVLYNKYTGGLDDGRLGMQLSHGCVRLDINNAKWIYDHVPSGSKVVVY